MFYERLEQEVVNIEAQSIEYFPKLTIEEFIKGTSFAFDTTYFDILRNMGDLPSYLYPLDFETLMVIFQYLRRIETFEDRIIKTINILGQSSNISPLISQRLNNYLSELKAVLENFTIICPTVRREIKTHSDFYINKENEVDIEIAKLSKK